MKSALLLALSVGLVAALFVCGSLPKVEAPALAVVHNPTAIASLSAPTEPPMDVCFAPGTPDSYMAEVERNIWGGRSSLDYFLGGRWSQTATEANTGPEGTPITLTYSFIPDGTTIHDNQFGSGPSVLFRRMNALFGSPAAWQAKFAQIFSEWSKVAGVTYILVSDDGANFPNTDGSLGHRGDVRIGMKYLDGPSNVLAYDFFPDGGDMVVDSSENWADPGQNYIFLRNVLAHEHGHGLGLEHVCPINGTKLLEPYYASAFDGPQHDDIRAGDRNYGDRYEPNNNAATATPLGSLGQDSLVQNVSLDHVTDIDYYSFSIPSGKSFTLTLQPVGYTYLNGQQNGDGSCSAGTLINTLNDLNLDLYLYNSSGTVLLTQSSSHPAGEAEVLLHYPVSPSGGSFIAKVVGSGTDAVQMYDLEFNISNLNDPFLTLNPIVFDTATYQVPVTIMTRLVNRSPNTRHVSAMDVVGPFTVAPPVPLTIASNDSVTLSVTYTAAQLGAQTGSLTITHDGPGGTLLCALSGTAAGAWLQFVTSDSVTIRSTPVGGRDSTRTPIRAVGNIPLTITSVQAAAPFGLSMTLPLTLNPGQTVFIYPRFTPTSPGTSDGVIYIHTDGLYSPDTLFITGTATPVSVDNHPGQLPTVYSLAQNYPNPFNPTTTIAFDLPQASDVRVQVFDIEGRLVKELVNGNLPAGHHNVSFDGSALASGIYFYRLTSPHFTAMSKMALIK